MDKKTFLLVSALLLAPLSSATVLIEPPETEVNINGLETSFDIGFVNTGEKLNLSLDSQPQTDIQVDHSQDIVLDSSEITSQPEGSNWYYLGEGDYAKIQYITVDTSIPRDTGTRRHNFDLSISREYKTSRSRPNVEQVQEFNFEIFSTSDLINTGFESPEESNPEEVRDQREQNSTETNQQETRSPDSTVDDGSNTSSTEEDTAASGIDGVTILLVSGLLLTVGWLLKEVML
ncbi:MAG: hypothetical protein ACI83Q_000576 [Colwellia polaris]|jgi:hypothetical protein